MCGNTVDNVNAIPTCFIASNIYLMAEKAVERYEEKTALVVPIILRLVDWRSAKFDNTNVLPRNKKLVTSWIDRQEAPLMCSGYQ